MMKKIVLISMMVGALVSGANASSLVWGTTTAFTGLDAPDIVKADGNTMSVGDGYYMYLFLDGAPSVSDLNNLNSAAITETPIVTINGVTEYWDSLLSEDGVFFYDGYNSVTETANDSETYTALMISADATSVIVGDYSYVLFADEVVTQNVLGNTPFFNYELGDVNQGDWTAIPEPSTMLLGGIGLLGLWIRRRMSK
jgi:hypothetical protein